jgi:hypothetical protein
MQCNVGETDKIIRIVFGVVIIGVVGFYSNSWWGVVGIVPIVTALVSWCPVYTMFGMSTCKKD